MTKIIKQIEEFTYEAQDRLDGVVESFEDAWKSPLPPSIDDFIGEAACERAALLAALVHVDLEFRLKKGEAARVENYLAKYPELSGDANLVAQLAVAEYEQRIRREPDLTIDTYQIRFANLWERLQPSLAELDGRPLREPDVGTADRSMTLLSIASRRSPQDTDEVACDRTLATQPINGRPLKGVRPATPSITDPNRTLIAETSLTPTPIETFNDDFELLQKLGEGGMGVVYLARQKSLDRIVALKRIKSFHATKPMTQRFDREVKAAAGLDHPHIVGILEEGEHDDERYYVMKYISGGSLRNAVKDKVLDSREAAKIVKTVAEAVHYAHENGVLHRDLKPSNIMLDEKGQPYVVDFGLAGSIEGLTELTIDDGMIGTPAYAPPEQLDSTKLRSDDASLAPTCDVYSLGATLYHLLTGRPPFQAPTIAETIKQVLSDKQPLPPSELNPNVDRDLETICLKCLEKISSLRYVAAQEVAEDLRRFIKDEPIQARPVGRVERAIRWTRRNKPAAGMLLLLAIVAVGTTLGAFVFRYMRDEAQQLVIEKDDALKQKEKARLQSQIDLSFADQTIGNFQGQNGHITQSLIYFLKSYMTNEDPNSRASKLNLMSGYLRSLGVCLPHDSLVLDAKFSPDGREIVTGSSDGTARIWSVPSGVPVGQVLRHQARVNSVAFSPDGKVIATGSEDRSVQLWDAETGQPLQARLQHSSEVYGVTFRSQGDIVATTGFNHLNLWNVSTGELLKTIKLQGGGSRLVSFSPNGNNIIARKENKTVGIWDVLTGVLLQELPHELTLGAAAFSPNGKWLLTGTLLRVEGTKLIPPQLTLWDVSDGKMKWRVQDREKGHLASIASLAFTSDGNQIVTGSTDRTHRVWNAANGELISEERHSSSVQQVAISCQPQKTYLTLLTGNRKGTSCIWKYSMDWKSHRRQSIGHDASVSAVAFSPNGQWALVASHDRTARLMAVEDQWQVPFDTQVRSVALHPHKDIVAVGCVSGEVFFCDLEKQELVGEPFPHNDRVNKITFSPDGKKLAVMTYDKTITVWDCVKRTSTKKQLESYITREECITFCPDNKTLISNHRNGILFWDTTGEMPDFFLKHAEPIYDAIFAPNNQILLTCHYLGDVCLWDPVIRKRVGKPFGHPGSVLCAAFTPDGKNFATGCGDGHIRVWDIATGKQIGKPMRHRNGKVLDVAFSHDGKTLYSSGEEFLAYAWDTDTRLPKGEPMSHYQRCIDSLAVSHDGEALLTGSGFPFGNKRGFGSLNSWKLPPKLIDDPERIPLWIEVRTGRYWDEDTNSIQPLSFDEWNRRRLRLEELGGPPIAN